MNHQNLHILQGLHLQLQQSYQTLLEKICCQMADSNLDSRRNVFSVEMDTEAINAWNVRTFDREEEH